MDKTFDTQKREAEIYKMWEDAGYFTPRIVRDKPPFTILLPLPNANDPMHMGHALFTVQDILIRFHRMLGDPTLWLPGGDHAGIETQFVFERKLAKEDKSRFDFDRDTLYKMIEEFVEQNKNTNKSQMKRLGFSLDWTRYKYSLDPEIINIVLETFKKLHQDNLVYRSERLANYCTKCGTAFSDLETNYIEKDDQLYFLDYGIIQIATTRPETIFVDSAIAVNPNDPRYKQLIGKKAIIPLINKEIPIIADTQVDIKFGTGALKITPAHDKDDFAIGRKHQLSQISVINIYGRLVNVPPKYLNLKVNPARVAVIADLKLEQKLIKIAPYKHNVAVCYRCATTIEPMLMPQWYVKTKSLAQKAIKAVKSGETKIEPLPRFEKMYFDWLKNIQDWNISRQIVWGPRIPAWYCLDCNPNIFLSFIDDQKNKINGTYLELKNKYNLMQIKSGLQSLRAPVDATYSLEEKACDKCDGNNILQETDTFDTWFLSSQWPITTLKTSAISSQLSANNVIASETKQSPYSDNKTTTDFDYFYPTSVLDTMWDILFFWVARMMMMGIYLTGKAPFKIIHLHARVVDKMGQKMSKSKGNVINPLDMVNKYGADALRFALVFGAGPGSDIAISDDKVRGMRNFCTKLWNIVRFFLYTIESLHLDPQEIPFYQTTDHSQLDVEDQKIISELVVLITKTTNDLEKFRFSDAAQSLYEFTWHRLADKYIESSKLKVQSSKNKAVQIRTLAVLKHVIETILKLLHPFMPFITEELWQQISENKESLMMSAWPKTSDK